MFVIGLEFNLPKLRAMRKHVFGLGFFQVILTMLLTSAAALLHSRQISRGSWRSIQPGLVISTLDRLRWKRSAEMCFGSDRSRSTRLPGENTRSV